MAKMKVLIAGGIGLIGSALTRSLLKDGHQVTILTRNPAALDRAPQGAEMVGWDGKTSDSWGEVMGQMDAVVNLAGENIGSGRWTKNKKKRIRQSRIDSGAALCRAMERSLKRPLVVIQASAIGYYGSMDDRELDEFYPAGNGFLPGVAKEWEASTQPVEYMGVRRVVIRIGVVLDKKKGAFPLLLLPIRLFVGGAIGGGTQWISWIHLEDVVRAIRYLIEDGHASGVYNLAAPEPLTNRAFGKIIAGMLHRPFWLPIPTFAMKLVLGEMSALILESQRVSSRKLINLGFKFEYPTLKEAVKAILHKPLDNSSKTR